MQKAAFSIVNYQFDKVHIDLSKHNSKDLNLGFETNGVYYKENQSFEITFQVVVKNSNTTDAFVQIQCKGQFKFDNISSFNEIPDFFYRNSIAILFPYVRAYLSLVTTQANVPGIILPTLNLSHLENDLRRNTIEK